MVNHSRETKEKEIKCQTPMANPVWHPSLVWSQRKKGVVF